MDGASRREIEAIREDRSSSATALLPRAIALLRQAGSREALEEIARELSAVQPAMAGFRTACALALQASDPAAALDRLSQRLTRAPAAVARYAADLMLLGHQGDDLRIATCSRSLMTEIALVELARRARLVVNCGEGRPALEGQGLALALAGKGVAVHLYSDAGVSAAIPGSHALVVGADAVSRDRFINKVGTAAVCALAAASGVPVFLLTGREKIVGPDAFPAFDRVGSPDEIWTSSDPRVVVINPYFEAISMAFVTAVVTDAGVLDPVGVESARLI